MNHLPANLRYLREKYGLSRQGLCNKLYINLSTYGHWETGFALPQTKDLKILSEYFNVSIDWLYKKNLLNFSAPDILKNYMEIQMRLQNN